MKKKLSIVRDAVYSMSEVEELINLESRAIGRRVQSGELKASKLGNKYVFFGQDILDFLKSQQLDNR